MKRGRYWPLVVVGLLAFCLGVNAVLLVRATTLPSFAVERDYYAKAQAWDEKMAQDRRNVALGWSLSLDVRRRGTAGDALVEARLRDRTGRAVEGATVRLEAFHNARAAQVFETGMAPDGAGVYRAALPLRRPGLWEFRFRVQRGTDTYTRTLLRDLWSPP